jgi:hypothetical protein
MPTNMRKPGNFLIILATIALALGPLCIYFVGPSAQSRWVLAQAANEYQDGHLELASKTLERALAISQDITADPQYWKLRFQMLFDNSDAKNDASKASIAESLCQESADAISKLEEERLPAAIAVGTLFENYDRIDLAIELLEKTHPNIEQRPTVINNGLAYYRSLDKKRLDVALQEINQAIKQAVAAGESDLYQLYDTKAWVLHGLRQNQLAFKFADRSVREAYDSMRNMRDILEPDPIASDWALKMAMQRVQAQKTGPTSKEVSSPNPPAQSSDSSQDSAFQDSDERTSVPLLPDAPSDEPSGQEEPTQSESAIQTPEPSFRHSLSMAISKVVPSLNGVDRMEHAKSKLRPSELYEFERAARQMAILRFHRACILEDLGLIDEAEIDYSWLDRFGFTQTQNLR